MGSTAYKICLGFRRGRMDWRRDIRLPRISTGRRWQAFSGSRAIHAWLSTSWDLVRSSSEGEESFLEVKDSEEYFVKTVAARFMS